MRIRYHCHFGRLTGYARAARDYLLALHDVDDIQLEIAVLGDDLESPEGRYGALDSLAVRFDQVVGGVDLEIFHAPPRVLAALDAQHLKSLEEDITPVTAPAKRVAIVTWETSTLPRQFQQVLSHFDAVIVPSHFCAAVIGAELPPRVPIHVVPHCFDEDFWPLNHKVRGAERPYRFYSVGAWGERKNPLGVVRAYLHEFTKLDHVQLMLVCEGADLDEVRSLVARSGLPAEMLPELHVPHHGPGTFLDEDELVELHLEGDCFVSATRGEGWGLPMFEAAIVGKRVIAPQHGGQLDFLAHYPWYSPVAYQLTPCFGSEQRDRVVEHAGQQVQMSRVTMPPGVDCKQLWAEPDLKSLAAAMRTAYLGSTIGRSLPDATTERAALEARFGYKTVGPLLANLLRGIAWDSHKRSTP